METDHTLVMRYFRHLRGGSQPVLAGASDGNAYVVKFSDNLQGPHLQFNEAMGTELYRACGLLTAPWKVLRITESFIDQNPECWPEGSEGKRRPPAGLCFGSEFLGAPSRTLFELLPGSHFRHVHQVQWWLAWLVDICAQHSDWRQAIFLKMPSRKLWTYFIDFGHMFKGASGTVQYRHPRQCRYRDPRIYTHLNSEALKFARELVSKIAVDRVFRQLAALPDEWKTEKAIQNLIECLDRLSDRSIVENTLNQMVAWHQTEANKDISLKWAANPIPAVLRPDTQSTQTLAPQRKAIA